MDGMLPKNKLRRRMMDHLYLFAGEVSPQAGTRANPASALLRPFVPPLYLISSVPFPVGQEHPYSANINELLEAPQIAIPPLPKLMKAELHTTLEDTLPSGYKASRARWRRRWRRPCWWCNDDARGLLRS